MHKDHAAIVTGYVLENTPLLLLALDREGRIPVANNYRCFLTGAYPTGRGWAEIRVDFRKDKTGKTIHNDEEYPALITGGDS
ncbi:MAG TPA: hypothetical protein PK175_06520 [Syntrophales bacterium]|jgi:hypothetical protein|nr:hypothetical protein [Syntrophales bacterium]HON23034.1 hypothetical protein [Syntrophales bacterium]HOU78166.1 hypothetical protein [Syntrophales bacterium]HPC33067.1 hypothetical protein [Syntrophales bacterium]HQG34502.1 hypothetical protein [Syntrophales bacterium]